MFMYCNNRREVFMIKNKKINSMVAVVSACSLLTVGFTSEAASAQPEASLAVSARDTQQLVKLSRETFQVTPDALMVSTKDKIEEQQRLKIEEIERREREAKEKAEREAREKAAALQFPKDRFSPLSFTEIPPKATGPASPPCGGDAGPSSDLFRSTL